MDTPTPDQILEWAREAIAALHLQGTITAVKADGVVQVEAGTLWTVHFADRGTTRRWATFPVSFWQHDVADDRDIRRHFRGELRKKARVCPICYTRAVIERQPDRDVLNVDCPACGAYAIDGPIAGYLRRAIDAGQPEVVNRLHKVADQLAGSRDTRRERPTIGDDWMTIADYGL